MNKKYKIEAFTDEIEVESDSYEILEVLDTNNGTASATIKLTDVNGKQYGVTIPGFDYGNPVKDVDLPKAALKAFIKNELKKLEV